MGDVDREYESDYANFVLHPDPEDLIDAVDLQRKAEKESGGPLHASGICPCCENPRYGPGNPDWERDFDKDRE